MNYQLKPEIRVGRLSDIIPQIEAIGNVLVLTSKSINKIHQIQEVFNYQNCQVISSVEPELPFSNIEKIYEELKVFPELIIAIGGGSVMDLGKALSVSNDFLTLKGFFSRHLTNYEKCAIKRYEYFYKVNDYGSHSLDNCKCFDEVYARICYSTPVANL